MRAICSKQAVNTEQLDQLCKETSIKIVTHWPTFRFTPPVHQVLAHSAALIHKNESQGLGSLSKEPLEHNNKNLRSYREKLARKTTQQANLTDVLTRLWVKSDPMVLSYRSIVKCSFCNGQHNIRSCPHRQAAISGCLSLEDNLIACIVFEGDDLQGAADTAWDFQFTLFLLLIKCDVLVNMVYVTSTL